MVILRLRTVATQTPNLFRQLAVAGYHCATVAECSQHLAREERQATNGSDGTGTLRLILGANRLRGVFDNRQVMAPSNVQDRAHVGALAKQVNRDDGTGPRRDVRFEAGRVEVERC